MLDLSPLNIRILSRMGASAALSQVAVDLSEKDNKVIFLTSDVGSFSGLDRYKSKFPQSFYNVGISEQNMLGVAAGLAKENFNVFATTYAAFASLRCADQIKVNMGYMQLPIKLLGMAAGLSAGILGPTHMSIEDVATMRAIPNVVIISPSDCLSTIKAVLAVASYNCPVYLRLSGASNTPIVYKEDFCFEIGKAIELKQGNDITIVATGSMVANALKVASLLEEQNISIKVLDMHTIKPIDTDAIDKACSSKMIVTLEEHSIYGGLGSAVAEYLTFKQNHPRHLIIGIKDFYPHASDYAYLLDECGLSCDRIMENILNNYKELQ